jgi:hypothetical protein
MRLPQIDHAIEICETHLKSTDSFGSEIEIYLTGYLVVFICSIFEEHIEALVHARADRSADAFLASFVRSAMDQLFRSLKTSELVGLFNRFGAEHAKRFRLELMKNERAETFYNNLVLKRHDTAHKAGLELTFREVVQFYSEGHIVLDAVAAVLT